VQIRGVVWSRFENFDDPFAHWERKHHLSDGIVPWYVTACMYLALARRLKWIARVLVSVHAVVVGDRLACNERRNLCGDGWWRRRPELKDQVTRLANSTVLKCHSGFNLERSLFTALFIDTSQFRMHVTDFANFQSYRAIAQLVAPFNP